MANLTEEEKEILFRAHEIRERIRAEKGKLKDGSQVGTGVYVVQLTAEFVKEYHV